MITKKKKKKINALWYGMDIIKKKLKEDVLYKEKKILQEVICGYSRPKIPPFISCKSIEYIIYIIMVYTCIGNRFIDNLLYIQITLYNIIIQYT